MRDVAEPWQRIGTVVGEASTGRYSFILKSYQAKLGDIVATRSEVPMSGGDRKVATVWGRITSIDRFNPFFPAEAAQELANENIRFLDTVLSGSRDHLQAEVLILGTTFGNAFGASQLSPLTYPVKPSAEVLYPPADAIRLLLTGDDGESDPGAPKLTLGTLIARSDVEVSLSARDVVSRHLAILAMTGGGKTVAARRVIRELVAVGYPLVIFDPHGDYLGLYEKRKLFPDATIKVMYPVIRVRQDNISVITDLIDKMGKRLTDAQQQFYLYLLNNTIPSDGQKAADFIEQLIQHASNVAAKKRGKPDELGEDLAEMRLATMNVVKRSLEFVLTNLRQMEANNRRLREHRRFAQFQFEEMPDPHDAPDELVAPKMVTIFYLAGYDHLNQSAIVSIILEALFHHRSTLNDAIPPFQAVIEEAHNFIPSHQEGIGETPSLTTIRKVITEGRKFGTGLVLISQRPSRLDETTLAQCNSFLVLRLVNPRDKSFVRSVMENLSEADANILQAFGRGQGIVSGQAVRFPLLVQVRFDEDLVSTAIGDEDFIAEAAKWKPNPARVRNTRIAEGVLPDARSSERSGGVSSRKGRRKRPAREGIKPEI